MIKIFTAFFLLPILQNTLCDEEPSFRSSWNDDGTPILRMGAELNNVEAVKPKANGGNDEWLDDLRAGIYGLVHLYGYEQAKPRIEKLVEDTEKKENVMLHVEVNRDGKSRVEYKQFMRAASPEMQWPPTNPPPPQWLTDFKAFVKNLIAKYGRSKLDDHMKPVIMYVEKLNHVYIRDIDVDEFGEVHVNYVEKPRNVA